MKVLFSVTLFVFVFNLHVSAQSPLIAPYISAWKVSDTSQTHQAEATYNMLKQRKDIAEYHLVVNELYAFLKHHPDDRLWIRTVMYAVFGKIELGIWTEAGLSKDRPLLLKSIKLATQLKDDQLMAELYALYAELYRKTSNYILYNLKAIQLQEKVGISHFVYVANRYYNVSLGLYLNEEYHQSINFGLKSLDIISKEKKSTDLDLYILQTDIVGASYFMLGKADSSSFFYQKILDTLLKNPQRNARFQQLWIAIAKGNIGKVLAMQNQVDRAVPLIEVHLATSLKLGSFNNVAIAENNLGGVYLRTRAYGKALISYRNGYQYAAKAHVLREQVKACKGLADVFRSMKQTDSAFSYYALYHQYRDSLVESVNKGKLSGIKASIAFDNMQGDLRQANDTISSQRLIRNFILMAVVLLTIIALLLYNRKMLRQKYLADVLMHKRNQAEQEAKLAKAQIQAFTEHIIDKESLIVSLQKQLASGNEQLNESLLRYTLLTDTEWEKFRSEFSRAYPEFLPSLRNVLPSVSPAEERLSTLLCLKLTTSQIANTLGISKDSVGRSKRRLKQRLNLEPNALLEDFICRLS